MKTKVPCFNILTWVQVQSVDLYMRYYQEVHMWIYCPSPAAQKLILLTPVSFLELVILTIRYYGTFCILRDSHFSCYAVIIFGLCYMCYSRIRCAQFFWLFKLIGLDWLCLVRMKIYILSPCSLKKGNAKLSCKRLQRKNSWNGWSGRWLQ